MNIDYDYERQYRVIEKNYEKLIQRYKSVYTICLVDKKGVENELG